MCAGSITALSLGLMVNPSMLGLRQGRFAAVPTACFFVTDRAVNVTALPCVLCVADMCRHTAGARISYADVFIEE